jgi:membrane-bound metal-dependent hydrolase YbcI (DUF457 family)
MNGTGHLLTGIAVAVCITHDPIYIASLSIGSLLPDIDVKTSTLGRFNPFVGFMVHRGHTHSIIGSLIVSAPFMLISPGAYTMAFTGSMVHLYGDKIYSWLPKHSKFKIKIW